MKKYAICGMCYEGGLINSNPVTYTVQKFLGTEGEHRVYVYDDVPNSRTKLFDKKNEALEYIALHNLNDGACVSTKKHVVVDLLMD